MQGIMNRMGGTRQGKQGAFAEMLEERRLLSTVSWQYADDSNYSAIATLDVGDNITYGAYCEVEAAVGGSASAGEFAWDSYADDGLDSGWVDVELSLTVDGIDQIDLAVGGGDPINTTANAMESISKVVIDATVLNMGMAFSWQDISVLFYRDGQVVDSAIITTGPQADTMDYSASSVAQGVQVTTAQASCDQVVIVGQVRLQNDNSCMSPYEMFGQVRIYESA